MFDLAVNVCKSAVKAVKCAVVGTSIALAPVTTAVVMSVPTHAALAMPTVDVSTDIGTAVTWALALMGTVFVAKLGVPLAKWAFNAVRGFLGR